MKNQGLNKETGLLCEDILDDLSVNSPIRAGMLDWMERQIKNAKDLKLDQAGMLVTSDAIESLFGLAKSHGTGETKDPNRIALRLPALIGKVTGEEAEAVANMPHSALQAVTKEIPSLQADRRSVLSGKKTLEQIGSKKAKTTLLPMSKNGGIPHNNVDILDSYEILKRQQKLSGVSSTDSTLC